MACAWAQINTWNVFDCGVEFGGYKLSGIGREHGDEALHHYTIVALYALRVEYGHCRIRVDTASGKSWAVDLLNYGMLLGSPAAQQLRNCPAACIHGVAPRSMQVNVKQR